MYVSIDEMAKKSHDPVKINNSDDAVSKSNLDATAVHQINKSYF